MIKTGTTRNQIPPDRQNLARRAKELTVWNTDSGSHWLSTQVAGNRPQRTMTNPDSHQDSTNDRPQRGRDKGGIAARIGIALILLSGVLWFSLFAIPFLSLTIGQKAALAGAAFVGVQIAWWTGAALAGPRTVTRLRSWFGRRKKTDEP